MFSQPNLMTTCERPAEMAVVTMAIPVVTHAGLIPSQCTWTGGFAAVGKTAESVHMIFDDVKRLEVIGRFGA